VHEKERGGTEVEGGGLGEVWRSWRKTVAGWEVWNGTEAMEKKERDDSKKGGKKFM